MRLAARMAEGKLASPARRAQPQSCRSSLTCTLSTSPSSPSTCSRSSASAAHLRSAAHHGRYFVADRSIPGWATGMSLLATIITSVTFIAYPGAAYAGDWTLLVPGIFFLVVIARNRPLSCPSFAMSSPCASTSTSASASAPRPHVLSLRLCRGPLRQDGLCLLSARALR